MHVTPVAGYLRVNSEVRSDAETIFEAEGCSGTPGGGRYIVLRLFVSADTIRDCSFESNGCPHAHRAVGGMMAFLKNRKVEQASRLEANDLLILIGGLPDGKGYYASMAVEALQDALAKVGVVRTQDLNTHSPIPGAAI